MPFFDDCQDDSEALGSARDSDTKSENVQRDETMRAQQRGLRLVGADRARLEQLREVRE